MNISNHSAEDQLPEPIGRVVTQIAAAEPDAAETQSVIQALRQRPPAETIPVEPSRKPRATRRSLLVAFAATAVAMLLFVTFGRLPTASALEMLADALASKRCIKMISMHNGETHESWIMPATGQSAKLTNEQIEFFDANAETVLTYDRSSGELVRSVRFETEFGYLHNLVSAIIGSGEGNTPETIRGMKIVSSKVKSNSRDRTLVLELEPTKHRDGAPKMNVIATITLDQASNLPTHCFVKPKSGGGLETKVDWSYPDEGPANIFALGVDTSTKLIDRVPSIEVKPIIAGVYSVRVRFDDYVAVTVQAMKKGVSFEAGAGQFTLAAKQGDKLLFARLIETEDSRKSFQQKTREEAAELILARPDDFVWKGLALVDGKTEYRFSSSGVEAVKINLPPEEFIVPSWNSIPHFAGRPPLGIGRADVSSAIATEPKGGPEGCVLLQTSTVGSIPQAPSNPQSSERTQELKTGGFWVRADRDYLVMRQESEYDAHRSSFVLDSLDQSPKGFWYPTTAHQPGYNVGEKKIPPSHYSYHLDFEQKLPAKMFAPSYYETK